MSYPLPSDANKQQYCSKQLGHSSPQLTNNNIMKYLDFPSTISSLCAPTRTRVSLLP